MKFNVNLKVLFVIFFISFWYSSYSQLNFDRQISNLDSSEYKIRYSLLFQQDSTNNDFIKHEYMLLFPGKNYSMFLSENYYRSDTIFSKIHNLDQFNQYARDPNKPLSTFRFRIYKNYSEGKITVTNHIPGDSFLYEEKLDIFKFELTGGTDTINQLYCQEAKCFFGGRNWTVWFTPEIPINDGPYKFNGLPGLIVKVEDENRHYVFELENIETLTSKQSIYFIEKDYIKSTKKQFFKAKDAFRNDIVSRARDAGLNSDTQQKVANKMKQRNNPIELDRN